MSERIENLREAHEFATKVRRLLHAAGQVRKREWSDHMAEDGAEEYALDETRQLREENARLRRPWKTCANTWN